MTIETTPAIETHNQKASATWSSAGAHYDEVSRGIADSIEHCVLRLAPKPGERILDLACGTGWASRAVIAAAPGASVVGVDIAGELLAAARSRAAEQQLRIEYRQGDAERIPFETATFDAVISTCGIMFATKQEAAASELARVTKPGGRFGITTWKPDSTLAEMFAVMKTYLPPAPTPAPASPFAWGQRERVQELLAASFDLRFEEGTSWARAASAEAAWDFWSRSYGPIRTLAANLDEDRRQAFRRDIIAFWNRFRTELGVNKPRQYLLTIGVRR
jgi:ubiquinone/menaquinone biosynthesis C-methylase UbiE